MIAVAGIIASLLLLMYLAYRNHSVIVVAPICALVAVGVDGELRKVFMLPAELVHITPHHQGIDANK